MTLGAFRKECGDWLRSVRLHRRRKLEGTRSGAGRAKATGELAATLRYPRAALAPIVRCATAEDIGDSPSADGRCLFRSEQYQA